MAIDLAVNLGGIVMKNPVTVASGTFGYGQEYAELMDISQLGAITVKGIRLKPWGGNPIPRHVEVPGGMINAIGLQGPGVDAFIEDDMPFLRKVAIPVIVNIWGTSIEEYAEVAARFDGIEGVSALELNVSCPNVKAGGVAFGHDCSTLATLVSAVRSHTRLPIIPKLAPNVANICPFVRASQESGANAISLINTIPAMAIDIERRRPILANKSGGLSGAGIHPVAVKLVYDAASVATVPLLAMGGIFSAKDAIEFLLAGATAVAVGTATFIDPTCALKVISGIEEYMTRHQFQKVSDIRLAE